MSAEAGYNPWAMLDLEEFLIWLDEGRTPNIEDVSQYDSKENIFIPSHPNPQNRRSVIINVLKDKNRAIPNQTRQFTQINEGDIESLSQEMFLWQRSVEDHIFPDSEQDVIGNIQNAHSLSELLDSIQGYELFRKASIVHEMAANEQLVNRATLWQAISYEIRAQLGDYQSLFHVDTVNKNGDEDIRTIINFGKNYGYSGADVVIGGYSRSLRDREGFVSSTETIQQANVACKGINDSIDKLRPQTYVHPEQIPFDIKGEERANLEVQNKLDANREELALETRILKLFQELDALDGKIDIVRLLSGDFSQHPKLKEHFEALGIKNFHSYLKELQDQFKPLDIHHRLISIAGDKTTAVFPGTNTIYQEVDQLTTQEVAELLERTKDYRMVPLMNKVDPDRDTSRNFAYHLQFDQDIQILINNKLQEIASSLSTNDDEQELLYQILLGRITDISLYHSDIMDEIAANTRLPERNYWWSDITQIREFQKGQLAEHVGDIRIAPTFGGPQLEDFIKGQRGSNGYHQEHTTGSGYVRDMAENIGGLIDYIKVYYGEGEFEKVNTSNYPNYKYIFRLKPRTEAEQLSLVNHRESTLPSQGFELIKADDREKEIEVIIDTESYSDNRFEHFKQLAKAANYESNYLNQVIACSQVPVEQRIQYLIDSLTSGEFTLRDISKALQFSEDVFTIESIKRDREVYAVVMGLFRQIPFSPDPWRGISDEIRETILGLNFHELFFNAKINIDKFDAALDQVRLRQAHENEEYLRKWQEDHPYGYSYYEPTVSDPQTIVSVQKRDMHSIDIYEGRQGEEKYRAQLNHIFEFICDGGIVRLSEDISNEYGHIHHEAINWQNLTNIGGNFNIIGLVKQLGYPTSEIQILVNQILENNRDRYTPQEIDKWQSLVAYCQQPHLYRINYSDGFHRSYSTTIRKDDGYEEIDFRSPDAILEMCDLIDQMPECTYRDQCIANIARCAEDAVEYKIPVGDGYRFTSYQHPAREVLEDRIMRLMSTRVSHIGYGIEFQTGGKQSKINDNFIPKSENYGTDPVVGFYLPECVAADYWAGTVSEVIIDHYSEKLRTPFALDYRKHDKFKGIDSDILERSVLYDRLRILEDMVDSEVCEALALYSIQTAIDNLGKLKQPNLLAQELEELINIYYLKATSLTARQRLFELKLKITLGGFEVPINADTIKQRFSSQHEFINYITTYIPEKTAFRDSYIILASEAYPLKIGDLSKIANLLFSGSYDTSDREVRSQRGAQEFARSLKQNEHITITDIRELVLWLVDEKRQVKSLDEFLTKLTASPVGLKLLRGYFMREGLQLNEKGEIIEDENVGYNGKLDYLKNIILQNGILIATKTFIRLPASTKRKLVFGFLNWQAKRKNKQGMSRKDLASIIRAGMPQALQKMGTGIIPLNATFNSLIENSHLDNPVTQEVFFDLMLGEKGLLEGPVILDSDAFINRREFRFKGSEMHRFLDDILEVVFQRRGWDTKSREVASVVFHSFIEGLSPVRRTVVLHRMLTGLRAMDFNEPDQEILRSKLLNLALSSIGILGAKLGQIDELIPKGWGSQMSSLKHATEPMSKLSVAGIFREEDLSDEYVIVNDAGAASTACGYIVRNPYGNTEFVKVVRPEVQLEWKEDFKAVVYMLECLKKTGLLNVETGPLIKQLHTLVEQELQTGREVDNILQYVSAETIDERIKRRGIRPVEVIQLRVAKDGSLTPAKEKSLMIFEEALGTGYGWIELSKLKSDHDLLAQTNLNQIHETIVRDFLYRALELGSWHTDLHDGNIMVSREGIIRRSVQGDDMVLIDFGQTGTASEEKQANAARLLIGLGLYDRDEIATAIFNALEDKNQTTIATIKAQLSRNPIRLKDSAVELIAKYEVEEYLTNFLKASLNIMPYLRSLPLKKQFELIYDYMPQDVRDKFRTKLLTRVAKVIDQN